MHSLAFIRTSTSTSSTNRLRQRRIRTFPEIFLEGRHHLASLFQHRGKGFDRVHQRFLCLNQFACIGGHSFNLVRVEAFVGFHKRRERVDVSAFLGFPVTGLGGTTFTLRPFGRSTVRSEPFVRPITVLTWLPVLCSVHGLWERDDIRANERYKQTDAPVEEARMEPQCLNQPQQGEDDDERQDSVPSQLAALKTEIDEGQDDDENGEYGVTYLGGRGHGLEEDKGKP